MNSRCTALNRTSTVVIPSKSDCLQTCLLHMGTAFPIVPHEGLVYTTGLLPWFHLAMWYFWSHATNLDLFIWALIPCLVFAVPQGVWHCSLYSKSRSTWINFSWTLIFGSTWLCMLPLLGDHQCCALDLKPHETFSVDPTWNGPSFSCPGDTVACILGPNIFQLVYPRSSLTSSSLFPDIHCLAFGGLICFTFWFIWL